MKWCILLFFCLLLLTGCKASESYEDQIVDEIQIEMSKSFDVPIADVSVETIEHDGWRFTIKKFLIKVEGDNKTYMYIGNDFNDYELLIYEE